jgi:hypothetical protein
VPGLKKKPSTSELLDWLKLLMAEDIPPEALTSRDQHKIIPPLHGALLKNEQTCICSSASYSCRGASRARRSVMSRAAKVSAGDRCENRNADTRQFPGVASLVKAQYYGHPQNHFWRLVGAVIEEPLAEMDYEARKRTLLKHHIGLWDVIDACRREGSLDSNIRDPRHNDFSR